MVIGIGTDIIDIDRIERAIARERFMKKAFTLREQDYLRDKRAQSYAGCFAAKEAVAKALGTGFVSFSLTDIEILRNDDGQPVALLRGGALERARQIGVSRVHVSISHDGRFAAAFALAEGKTNGDNR